MTVIHIFPMLPSLTSTDKSVCATLILPSGVAQTLLSVLWQDARPDIANPGDR